MSVDDWDQGHAAIANGIIDAIRPAALNLPASEIAEMVQARHIGYILNRIGAAEALLGDSVAHAPGGNDRHPEAYLRESTEALTAGIRKRLDEVGWDCRESAAMPWWYIASLIRRMDMAEMLLAD